MKKLLFSIIITGMCFACNPYKKISYIQGIDDNRVDYLEDTINSGVPDPVLKIGDLLVIMVNNATSPEAAAAFNLPWMPAQGLGYRPTGALSAGGGGLQSYLIDTEGYIVFPSLGRIHIAGMTKSQLNHYLVKQLYPKYMNEEPVITIRFSNFRITIIREEGGSSSFNIDNEKISIFEALAMGGGLSLHARRDNVMLIRETPEGRKTYQIDLRDKNLLKSPYYWLQQSDVLYIHADPQSARSTYFGQVENMALSLVSMGITLTNFTFTMINYIRTEQARNQQYSAPK